MAETTPKSWRASEEHHKGIDHPTNPLGPGVGVVGHTTAVGSRLDAIEDTTA